MKQLNKMPDVGEKSGRELFELFSDTRSDNDQERIIHIKGFDGFLFQKSAIRFLASVPPICLTFDFQHWGNSTGLTSLVKCANQKLSWQN